MNIIKRVRQQVYRRRYMRTFRVNDTYPDAVTKFFGNWLESIQQSFEKAEIPIKMKLKPSFAARKYQHATTSKFGRMCSIDAPCTSLALAINRIWR